MHLFAILHLSLMFLAVRADECQPATWTKEGLDPTTGLHRREWVNKLSIISTGDVPVGEINCRDAATTGKDVNYYTCTKIASERRIPIELFFKLNPTLLPDCSNIKPYTPYCTAGCPFPITRSTPTPSPVVPRSEDNINKTVIEPLRSTDGYCGPHHNNATCLGTDAQCCNSLTWTCGDSVEDCAKGTCYEGACYGDRLWSTDGTCGIDHGMRYCAGIQGDCCSVNGTCGTGEAFCGLGNCQLGNCTWPEQPKPERPAWLFGNTTDGTCGGANKYTCNVVYGLCCNKDNMCGILPTDCGEGCQPEWGTCSSASTSTPSSVPTTKLPTTSSSSSSRTSPVPTTTQPTKSTTTTSSSTLDFRSLPTCGQTCIKNMQDQHKALGCSSPDPACLCKNANFGYGIRDCSNGACHPDEASTVIAYGSALCRGVTTTAAPPMTTTQPTAPTHTAPLPSCGQLCFKNMLAEYSQLGCATPDPYCLCKNVNFGYGLRDCAHGACSNAADAESAIAYGSAYCASASATATVKA